MLTHLRDRRAFPAVEGLRCRRVLKATEREVCGFLPRMEIASLHAKGVPVDWHPLSYSVVLHFGTTIKALGLLTVYGEPAT